MALNYTIRGFDEQTGSITVEFHDVGTWNLDLPIENGMYPEGEAFEKFIQGFYPSWVIERRNTIKNGIPNANSIAALVEPLIQNSTTVPNTMFAEDYLNAQMWSDVEFERKLSAALVKFGVLDSDPTAIPVAAE